jgi:hypothetical protein
MERHTDAEAHGWAVEALRAKYPQYRQHAIDVRPMIRVAIAEVVSWEASRGSSEG